MPYGQGKAIGAGYNPAMGLYDYSGYVDAAKTQADGITRAIGMVTNAGLDVMDERKKNKQQITSSKQTAKAIAQLIPELQPVLDEQISLMDDEERPLSERAGVASAITDILNLGTAEIKGRALMGMEAKRLQLAEMDTMSSITARNAASSEAIDRTLAMGEIGSFNLGSAINIAKQNPSYERSTGVSASELEQARDLSPMAQTDLAAGYLSRLPKDAQRKLANLPATINGQPGEIPVLVDDFGNIQPVAIDGSQGVLPPKGWQDQDAAMADPPAMLQTTEGAEIPAEESELIGEGTTTDGKPTDVWKYNGVNYTTPTQRLRDQVKLGRQMVSPKETPSEMLTKKRMVELDTTLSTVRDQGMELAQDIGSLERATTLLDEMKTGFTKETQMKAKRIFGADVATQEEFQSLAGKFVMSNVALTKGAVSDKEMEYFKNELSPGMGKSTEGNKRIINFKLNYAKRAQQIGNFIAKAQAAGMDPFAIRLQVDQFINDNPLTVEGDAQKSPVSSINNGFRALQKD